MERATFCITTLKRAYRQSQKGKTIRYDFPHDFLILGPFERLAHNWSATIAYDSITSGTQSLIIHCGLYFIIHMASSIQVAFSISWIPYTLPQMVGFNSLMIKGFWWLSQAILLVLARKIAISYWARSPSIKWLWRTQSRIRDRSEPEDKDTASHSECRCCRAIPYGYAAL